MNIFDLNLNQIIEKLPSWLMENYGLEGTLKKLAGEGDLNFKLNTGTDSYVIKLSDYKKLDDIISQSNLLNSVSDSLPNGSVPKPIRNKQGEYHSIIQHDHEDVILRALSWVEGRMWSAVNPITDRMRYDLGQCCGLVTGALSKIDKKGFNRILEWDIAQGPLIEHHLHLFEGEKLETISSLLDNFKRNHDSYSQLRKGVVHNDANDNNIVLSADLYEPKVLGLIDYGDAVYTQIINDVAISCCYAIIGTENPLMAALPIIEGYHSSYPLEEAELEHLYHCIGMRLALSVTYSALNIKAYPDNEYLTISEKPFWDLIDKWKDINPDFAHYAFRHACGFHAHPDGEKAKSILNNLNFSADQLFPEWKFKGFHLLDLRVSSEWIGHKEEFNDLEFFQYKINALRRDKPNLLISGGYMEPRPIYTASSYDRNGNNGMESRTVHLGIDFWLPEFTAVHCLFDSEVIAAVNDAGEKEYGGMVILKHKIDNLEFYSLYGHLSVDSALRHQVGDQLKAGDKIGELGDMNENGDWAPHLHFQLMLSMLDYKIDFPGVAYPSEQHIWKDLCPDPNLLFKIDRLKTPAPPDYGEVKDFRSNHLGKGLSLHYSEPLHMVRGEGVYLMDYWGQKYLDTVNNVAHVGHENFEVVKAGKTQMGLLNTNTRYLHENINELAIELLETLPDQLQVVHFVNSGSEANELAIRMAETHTHSKEFIVSEVGYHGNTNACVQLSSYKFDGKGGSGAPENVHVIPLPDRFRGKYRGKDSGQSYLLELETIISDLKKGNKKPAALLMESIISCGGQIELPEKFLSEAYKLVRDAGGLCIADEVQTGCGRVGKHFWAFELYDVVPDIVTIGKPLGNGHPIGAVVCTREVAQSFANGMEYFNTFGGNPVSAKIGSKVIQIVKRDQLDKHALEVGEFLKNELRKLAKDFPIIADVRGQGLFLGFELTDADLIPLPAHADYLINRMSERGILMSTDGPDHNVIKIKPPMIFSLDHAERLICELRIILREDSMKI